MKAKVLNVLAELPFEVLAYAMETEKCITVAQLAAKMCKRYIKEDAHRIASDLQYCYDEYISTLELEDL